MSMIPFLDPASLDLGRILYGIESIRLRNPQRFEMEQLTAIVHLDGESGLVAGYKDAREDEFWARGRAAMPGSLICEAAAQLCSFYCHTVHPDPETFMGFGGMEGVEFLGPVRAGERLLLVGKEDFVRKRLAKFRCQGFVEGRPAFVGTIVGIPLPRPDAESRAVARTSRGVEEGHLVLAVSGA